LPITGFSGEKQVSTSNAREIAMPQARSERTGEL